MKMIRENQGLIISVSDTEIMRAQKLFAEAEGIFCDPASATTLAALLQLSKKDKFKNSDKIVLIITGSGLKTVEDLSAAKIHYHNVSLKRLEKKMENVLF